MDITIQKKNFLRDLKNAKPHYFILEVKDKENLDGPIIHRLLIKREEIYKTDDNEVSEARITLQYKVLSEKGLHTKGSFFGGYRRNYDGTEIVSLSTPTLGSGGIFLDPTTIRSQRIGTYLMNEIVAWAKQWPEASVNPIRLVDSQTDTESSIRRNRFYERFGLAFHYHSDKNKPTQSEPICAANLKQVDSWKKNIREHDWLDAMDDLTLDLETTKLELKLSQKALKSLSETHQAITGKPIRWALRYSYSTPKLLIVMLCAMVGIKFYLG